MKLDFLTVDIDDTIIKSTVKRCDCGGVHYDDAKPIQQEIDWVNAAYEAGTVILLVTGRGWGHYHTTKEQLKQFGVNYHELIMGKTPGPYIDKTMNYNEIGEIL